MKNSAIRIVTLSLVMFVAFACLFAGIYLSLDDKPAQAEDYVEIKNFSIIDIDVSDNTKKIFYAKDMLGIDGENCSGSVLYQNGYVHIKDFCVYQVEDSMKYDENDVHLPMIYVHNSGNAKINNFRIFIEGENSIVCFGSAIGVYLPTCDECSLNIAHNGKENVLRLHSKRTYLGEALPAIDTAVDKFTIGEEEADDEALTLSVSGVGGIHGADYSTLYCNSNSNVFIQLYEDEIYYTPEDPDNYISFDEDEDKESFPAIDGFKAIDFVEHNDFKRINSMGMFYYQHDENDHYYLSNSNFYYGRFTVVDNEDDFKYILSLKAENQTNPGFYDNILLTENMTFKYDFYPNLLEGGGMIPVRGLKRIFLSYHCIYAGQYSETLSYKTNYLFSVYGKLDVHGLCLDYPSLDKNDSDQRSLICHKQIDFAGFADPNYSYLGLFHCQEGSRVTLNGRARYIAANDDKSVYNLYRENVEEADGQAFLLETGAELVMFGGRIHGGNGVVRVAVNDGYNFKMVDGLITSSEDEVIIFHSPDGASIKPMRYYGGVLYNYDEEDIFACVNSTEEKYSLSTGGLSIGDASFLFVNEKAFMHVYGGVGSSAYAGGMSLYDGLYPVSELSRLYYAKEIYYGTYLKTPYIKKDLPEEITLNTATSASVELELFNPDESYSVALVLTFGDEKMVWAPVYGNGLLKLQPYSSIRFEEVDGKYNLTILPSLSLKYSGLKAQIVITNTLYNVTTYSVETTITIHADEAAAKIVLTAPSDAFNADGDGVVVPYGAKETKKYGASARITSASTNVIYAQWLDVTDENNPKEATANIRFDLTKKDENGVYYTDFAFYPPSGDSAFGTHKYQLVVMTPATYDDTLIKTTTSEILTYTVKAAAPVISVQPVSTIYATDGDTITASFEVADDANFGYSLADVAYKWYRYPNKDYMLGIGDSKNVTLVGLNYQIFADGRDAGLYTTKSGSANYFTIDLTDSLTIGGQYRVVFTSASSVAGGNVTVTLKYGLLSDKSVKVEKKTTYEAKLGGYEYACAFMYDEIKYGGEYVEPEYCYLEVDFSETAKNTNHEISEFYLQKCVGADGYTLIYENYKDLNPYYYAIGDNGQPSNWLGLLELAVDGQAVTDPDLNYVVSASENGSYVYCKVYNKYYPDLCVYTNPISLRIDEQAIEPRITETSDATAYVTENDENIEFYVLVESPFYPSNGQRAVNYEWRYSYVDANGYTQNVSKTQLSEVALQISESVDEITGKAQASLTLFNKLGADGAKNWKDGKLHVVCYAYSESDASLYDTAEFDLYVVYDHTDVKVMVEEIGYRNYESSLNYSALDIDYDDFNLTSRAKYVSKNGADIQDIVFVTDGQVLKVRANVDIDEYYPMMDPCADYWKYEWFICGVNENGIYLEEELGAYLAYYGYDKYVYTSTNSKGDLTLVFLSGSDIVPDCYNLVLFCKANNEITGKAIESVRFQASYIPCYEDMDLTCGLSDDDDVKLSDVSIDDNGDINAKLTVRVAEIKKAVDLYQTSYAWSDANYRNNLAYNKGDNSAPVIEPRVVAKAFVFGPGYIENSFVVENDEYYYVYFNYSNSDDAVKASYDSANNQFLAYTMDIKIPFDLVYDWYYGETSFTDQSVLDKFEGADYELVEGDEWMSKWRMDVELTEEEIAELGKNWYDHYRISAYYEYYIGASESPLFTCSTDGYYVYPEDIFGMYVVDLGNSAFDAIFDKEYEFIQKTEGDTTAVLNIVDLVNKVDGASDYSIEYEWYVVEDASEQSISELLENGTPVGTDAYFTFDVTELRYDVYLLKIDVSAFNLSSLQNELDNAIANEDEDLISALTEKLEKVRALTTKTYVGLVNVYVIRELAKTPIISVGETSFGYMIPDCQFIVEADNPENADLEYLWEITVNDNVQTIWTDTNTLPIYTGELCAGVFKVKIYSYKDVELQYGNEKISRRLKGVTVSDEYAFEVVERVIDAVYVAGITQPIVGETPSTSGIAAVSDNKNDEYVGYTISSAFWINPPATFEYDGKYVLQVILNLKENAKWIADANDLKGYFISANYENTVYDCSVSVQNNQVMLTYEFDVTKSELLKSITIEKEPVDSLPAVEVGNLIREFVTIETQTYVLSGVWNVTQGNFAYGKEYVLTLTVKPSLGYAFDEEMTVLYGNDALEYTVEDDHITIVRSYFLKPTVSFDANGGSGSMSAVEVYGEYELPECGFIAPEGKAFLNWSIGENTYEVGAKINVTENVAISAKWQDLYVIAFDKGEGKGTMASVTRVAGKYVLPECEFAPPQGQRFKEWKIGNDTYAEGDEITVTKDVTVTATFEDIPVILYTVTYVAGEGSGNAIIVNVAGSYALVASTFTAPEGKRFKAWLIGETEYAEGDSVTVTADITVTAIYEDEPEAPVTIYTVTFVAGEGTGSMDAFETENTVELPESTFIAPEGKRFKGWLIGETEYAEGDSVTVTEDITVTAIYEDIPVSPVTIYTVTFVAGEGTGSMDALETEGTFNLPECEFTAPEGKEFECWIIGNTEYNVGDELTIAEDVTITASWKDVQGQSEEKANEVDIEQGKEFDLKDVFDNAKEDDGEVIIKIGNAEIVFDKDAVADLFGKDVKITVNIISANLEKANIADAKLIAEITLSTSEFNGKATVTLPFDLAVPDGKVAKVYYVDQDGKKEDMKAVFANGKATFTTSHFSTYAIVFENVVATTHSEPSEKSGLSGGAIAGIVIGAIVFAAGVAICLMFLFKKKKSAARSTESGSEEAEVKIEDGEKSETVEKIEDKVEEKEPLTTTETSDGEKE